MILTQHECRGRVAAAATRRGSAKGRARRARAAAAAFQIRFQWERDRSPEPEKVTSYPTGVRTASIDNIHRAGLKSELMAARLFQARWQKW